MVVLLAIPGCPPRDTTSQLPHLVNIMYSVWLLLSEELIEMST